MSAKLVRDLPDNTAKKVKIKRQIFFDFTIFTNISASRFQWGFTIHIPSNCADIPVGHLTWLVSSLINSL